MNTNTYEVYQGPVAINAALKGGEPLVEVPPEVANMNRAERRRWASDAQRRGEGSFKQILQAIPQSREIPEME